MAYIISYDGPILLIRIFGTLTPEDLEALADEVIAIEQEGTNTPPRLTDLRELTSANVGYQEMARLTDRTRTRPLLSPVRSAMLVGEPVQLGYARMFQILNDHPKVTLRIFEDEAVAREWVTGGSVPDDTTA